MKELDVQVYCPKMHKDARGLLAESFNSKHSTKVFGKKIHFCLDILLEGKAGALRGLHYQVGEDAQYKLVQVIKGTVFDIALCVDRENPNFGGYVGKILRAHHQMLIPPGYAHGLLSLTPSIVMYKTDRYPVDSSCRSVRWDDPFFKLEWPEVPRLLSEKDRKIPDWEEQC